MSAIHVRAPFTCDDIYLEHEDMPDALPIVSYYSIMPAEPDVGIMTEGAQVHGVSTYIEHLGEILFAPAEEFRDQIQNETQAHLANDLAEWADYYA